MKHISSRHSGAPIRTVKSRLDLFAKDIFIFIKSHRVAKTNGWYPELPNFLRHVHALNNGPCQDQTLWLINFINGYLVPWVSRNIANEDTKLGLLECLRAMKDLLIANYLGGNKRVETCIAERRENDEY